MNEPQTRISNRRWLLMYVAPPVIVLGSLVGLVILAMVFRPEADQKPPQPLVPAVEVHVAQPSRVQISVASQGAVEPRAQTTLFAEVSGRVERVSPELYAGGFFDAGDVLVSIDPTDYEAALAAARSRAADARLAFEQERAASEQALDDWSDMEIDAEPGALVLRKPQLERAQAALDAAMAAVALAERDLERTKARAPFAGRALEKFVDIGQVVTARSSQLAIVYGVDFAEIRLPLSVDDARYLTLPESFRDAGPSGPRPRVILEADYAGKRHQWEAAIDRVEGVIDPQTRLLHAIAQVADPYRAERDSDRPPLKVGLFVTARIFGHELESAFAIPRQALRRGDRLFVVDAENRLRIIQPEIYQRNVDTIVVTDGLKPGDRVCMTPLEYAVEGMSVVVEGASSEPELQP